MDADEAKFQLEMAERRLQGRENHIYRTGRDLARAEQAWDTNRGHSQLRQRYGMSYRQHFRDARDRAVRDFEKALALRDNAKEIYDQAVAASQAEGNDAS